MFLAHLFAAHILLNCCTCLNKNIQINRGVFYVSDAMEIGIINSVCNTNLRDEAAINNILSLFI
jgi:hypothetical protein